MPLSTFTPHAVLALSTVQACGEDASAVAPEGSPMVSDVLSSLRAQTTTSPVATPLGAGTLIDVTATELTACCELR